MTVDERDQVIRRFNEARGVLLITPVITEGYEFADVNCLMLYYVPLRQNALEQLFGRFHRIGRESLCGYSRFRWMLLKRRGAAAKSLEVSLTSKPW